MKPVRWLMFLAAFQMEMRVRAGVPVEPIGHPEKCWTTQVGPCSVQAGTGSLHLKNSALDLWGGGESLFTREADDWRFLKGNVRATALKEAELSFPYGKVKSKEGEFWIVEDSGNRFVIRATRGSAYVVTRDGRELEIPEGLELWVGPVSSVGTSTYGVPSLIPVEEHLRLWSQLKDLPKEKFIQSARELRERWKGRQEVASVLYDKVAQRHLASVEEQKKLDEERARAKAAERDKFRKMLYQRAFER